MQCLDGVRIADPMGLRMDGPAAYLRALGRTLSSGIEMAERTTPRALRCPVCEAEYDQRTFRPDATPKCAACKAVLEEQYNEPRALADFDEPHSSAVGVPAMSVIITGLNLPFPHLVGFLVKLALAAIPAVIILALLWWLLGLLIVGVLGSGVAI